MIEFDNFSFSYATASKKALQQIHWHISPHKITILCGKSGCGKTTILRYIKEKIRPAGRADGKMISSLFSQDIAMVFQDPNQQLFCSSVLQDLVFQMENIALPPDAMKKRLAETVCFFGIEPLLHRAPESLSGGQKQVVALCSAMMTYPKLLILDEPLSQLDPIAQTEFLQTLRRMNEEFGVTILMSEHRLNEVISFADEIAVMENGTIIESGSPENVIRSLYESGQEERMALVPDVAKASLKLLDRVLLTPRQLKENLSEKAYHLSILPSQKEKEVF